MLGDLPEALGRLKLPLFIVDASGTVVWQNAAGLTTVGDFSGAQYTTALAPESRTDVVVDFTRKMLGTSDASAQEAVLIGRDGRRWKAEISTVALTEGRRVVGVFGAVIVESSRDERAKTMPELTPRQAQVLDLLVAGASTDQMAETLHLSRQTVRNHVRALLRRLGVHSRLEAVVEAQRRRAT